MRTRKDPRQYLNQTPEHFLHFIKQKLAFGVHAQQIRRVARLGGHRFIAESAAVIFTTYMVIAQLSSILGGTAFQAMARVAELLGGGQYTLKLEFKNWFRHLVLRLLEGLQVKHIYRLLIPAVICCAGGANASTWEPIRTSSNETGWQAVVCDNATNAWESCEMGLTVVLTATPAEVSAGGEQSMIVARVTDYFGSSVGAGTNLIWATTDGSLSASQSVTGADGTTSIVLTSSNAIGGATVTATTVTNEGAGSLYVPFNDKWEAYTPAYTAWANNGQPYSCSAWTPSADTVAAGTSFTQSATCYQDQYAYRQDRQRSVITGEVRNVGSPVLVYQTVQVTVSQTAVGTKQNASPQCVWDGRFDNNDIATKTGWYQYTNNATWTLYFHGPTGIQFRSGSARKQAWDGYVDYNGYRITVGQYVGEGGIGKNGVNYFWQVCYTPL